MGRSWKTAVRSKSAANWDNPDPVYSTIEDLWFQPFSRGEDLFVMAYRVESGDTVHKRIEKIDYIVGSGQHTNSHIYEENGFLYQIPVTWYSQDGFWDLAPGFQHRLMSPFQRPITSECMACHNGRPGGFEPGSENRFSDVAIGIDCERCHGPGLIHKEAIDAGILVNIETEIDYKIVHPGKLTPERQLDLCKRCHMQAAEVFAPGVHPEDFRPGRPLSMYENVYWIRQPDSTTVFNMESHPDRMEMSQCFRATWSSGSDLPKMTCVTCHDPHLALEAVEEGFYNDVCQSCHAEDNHLSCSEPSVVNGTATEDCFSCHMPVSKVLDIPHVRVSDHFIRVPGREEMKLSEVAAEDQKRFIRLVGLVDRNPSFRDKADGLLSYFELITNRPGVLDSAAVYLQWAREEDPSLDLAQSYIRLWYFREDYAAIRRFIRSGGLGSLEDAWTLYRIGEAFATVGDALQASSYFERALALGPNHLRIKDRMAVIYTTLGATARALGLFDEILTANPKFENSYTNRGFVYLSEGRFDEAESDFKTAISLNPNSEMAMANLASLYYNTNRPEEARPLVRRLIQMKPENTDYTRLWRVLNR